jgi:hypothetical protein
LEESGMGWGGAHRWLVVIFTPMFLHVSMQLGKVLNFYKVTSITKKINNKNKEKPKPKLCTRIFK